MSYGRKREAILADEFQIISIIATAIRDSRINFSDAGNGTVRDRIFQGNEDTIPFAKAILAALDEAGLEIVPKGQK
jgi:hypothetical protein